MASPATVKVVALCTFAQPNWAVDKGETMEVSVPEARRMIGRGLAKLAEGEKMPNPTPEEVAAAKVLHVEVAEQITDGALEKAVRVRPARTPKEIAQAKERARQQALRPGRVDGDD